MERDGCSIHVQELYPICASSLAYHGDIGQSVRLPLLVIGFYLHGDEYFGPAPLLAVLSVVDPDKVRLDEISFGTIMIF